ncbi:hypothetical protein SAMN05216223_11418 [Actinacidiphila yanglinensis]|uniref:Uncharacterized protein n=1 Tax=Actinacidiphila yanglinensis TaxID=310779 RepID=A0A1H6DCL0_9ACTN|nr:hypothetical protein [Actinacidiphila yanglinensis]SEG83197.1 hypothetical protein SAMN05216223_11418 [Actinacidiphila yanglinensis]
MDSSHGTAGPLSDEEGQQFVTLLRRYLHHELDQFEFVMTETEYGPIYAIFTNKLPEGWPAEAFRPF